MYLLLKNQVDHIWGGDGRGSCTTYCTASFPAPAIIAIFPNLEAAKKGYHEAHQLEKDDAKQNRRADLYVVTFDNEREIGCSLRVNACLDALPIVYPEMKDSIRCSRCSTFIHFKPKHNKDNSNTTDNKKEKQKKRNNDDSDESDPDEPSSDKPRQCTYCHSLVCPNCIEWIEILKRVDKPSSKKMKKKTETDNHSDNKKKLKWVDVPICGMCKVVRSAKHFEDPEDYDPNQAEFSSDNN